MAEGGAEESYQAQHVMSGAAWAIGIDIVIFIVSIDASVTVMFTRLLVMPRLSQSCAHKWSSIRVSVS